MQYKRCDEVLKLYQYKYKYHDCITKPYKATIKESKLKLKYKGKLDMVV